MRKILFVCMTVVAATAFVGCSKNDSGITLAKTEVTLYFGEEYQIEAETDSNLTYASENEYHATVSDTGLVSALFVGETNIIVSDGNNSTTLRVIVAPESNLYEEPCLEWGARAARVEELCGTPDSNDGESWAYMYPTKAVDMIMYMFENGLLQSAGVMVKSGYSTELATYLAERYMSLGYIDNIGYVFVNGLTPETVTTMIAMQPLGNYMGVVYTPWEHDTYNENAVQSVFKHLSLEIRKK